MSKDTLFCAVAFVTMLAVSGCALGGARETTNVVICEVGEVVEVATDSKIDVIVTTDDGKKAIAKKNMAGTVAMPKSVYRAMRECWLKAHPAEESK